MDFADENITLNGNNLFTYIKHHPIKILIFFTNYFGLKNSEIFNFFKRLNAC